MKLFTNFLLLRRLVRAFESISRSQETLARLAQKEWNLRHSPRPIVKMQIGTLDVAAANERWRRMQQDQLVPSAEEDER